jgi:hAT family C-terminal dimerisation region
MEAILNSQAPNTTARVQKPTFRRDELHLYLTEPPTDLLGVIEYWKARESEWPHLAKMAFDFFSVLAMSFECKRVFSSCSKQTTPKSSKLSGKHL